MQDTQSISDYIKRLDTQAEKMRSIAEKIQSPDVREECLSAADLMDRTSWLLHECIVDE